MFQVISELHLVRYKGFSDFRLRLGRKNMIIGPNNAGKSTIIGALRLTAAMTRYALRRNPSDQFTDGNRSIIGFPISAVPAKDTVGFVFENIRHEFIDEEPARLMLSLSSDAVLHTVWPAHDRVGFFYMESRPGMPARHARHLKGCVPSIAVVPVLNPIEHREEVLTTPYVQEHQNTRLASRHFRNQLFTLSLSAPDRYAEFVSFALDNTPEIESLRLAVDRESFPNELDVFFVEAGGRREKELYWAGDGLQVWLQVLYHLFFHHETDVLVLDEPDVYLHPDLQRRLVGLLEDLRPQTLVATHAPEMLTEAARETVVWVDRTRKSARRARDERSLDQINTYLGSGFNLGIARALRSRLALFVEGRDMRLLRNLSRSAGASLLPKERGVTVIPLQGFTNWSNVKPFSWMVRDLLGDAVKIAVLLDRDYRGDEAVYDVEKSLHELEIVPHVWRRKELESYLIVPAAISRLSGLPEVECDQLLEELAESLRVVVQSNYLAQRRREATDRSINEVTVNQQLIASFEKEWVDRKLEMVPAKELLHGVNERLQAAGLKPVSTRGLSNVIRKGELASELVEFVMLIESLIRTG